MGSRRRSLPRSRRIRRSKSCASGSTPLPDHPAIIATGPLTGSKLAEAIAAETGQGALAFFDAIAPIVHRDSIDMDVAWMAARWDKGGKDYINCPLDKEQYRGVRRRR